MSAGGPAVGVVNSLDVLAPKFRAAVEASLEDCHAAGLDAVVFESKRSDALAALYYKRGRPPTAEYPHPVTNAPDASHSWHGYGLAVDVISAADQWNKPDAWFAQVAEHFKAHGCEWGGDWRQRDLPHFQWGTLRDSPSETGRRLYASGQLARVWQLVNAV